MHGLSLFQYSRNRRPGGWKEIFQNFSWILHFLLCSNKLVTTLNADFKLSSNLLSPILQVFHTFKLFYIHFKWEMDEICMCFKFRPAINGFCPVLTKSRRPNRFPGLSLNVRNILYLVLYCSKTVLTW